MTEEMSTEARNFNMYGFRQEEFSWLPAYAQTEVVEYCHAIALMMDYAKSLETVQVMSSGTVITRGMLDDELRATRAHQATPVTHSGRATYGAHFPRSVTELI